MKTIKGKFEIKATPQPTDEATQHIGAMRMIFEKSFSGSLEAKSLVSMLGIMNKDLGSGGYVALERIEGTLDGRRGSFCLQHSSSMAKGKSEQSITVIPDTGTEELLGLTGKMIIDIIDGQHFYTFDYSLPA